MLQKLAIAESSSEHLFIKPDQSNPHIKVSYIEAVDAISDSKDTSLSYYMICLQMYQRSNKSD